MGLCRLAGAAKDIPVVTPLMDFVRQKRAAKGTRVFFAYDFEILKKLIWFSIVILPVHLCTFVWR